MKIFVLAICLFGLFSYQFFGYAKSRAFSQKNLLHAFPKNLENQGAFSFSQKHFYFLGEGAQVYAFASEDGKTVLKLFKARHIKPQKKWLKNGPLFWSCTSEKKQQKWIQKFQETCARYTLAFEKLHEETGLLCLHFTETDRHDEVWLHVSGNTYLLDLSHVPFVVQEKGELVPDRISRLLQEGKQEEAHRDLVSLSKLLHMRTAKGFTDPRQCFSINFAFVGAKPIQIDPGKLMPVESAEEYEKIQLNLAKWVSKHFPALQE